MLIVAYCSYALLIYSPADEKHVLHAYANNVIMYLILFLLQLQCNDQLPCIVAGHCGQVHIKQMVSHTITWLLHVQYMCTV